MSPVKAAVDLPAPAVPKPPAPEVEAPVQESNVDNEDSINLTLGEDEEKLLIEEVGSIQIVFVVMRDDGFYRASGSERGGAVQFWWQPPYIRTMRVLRDGRSNHRNNNCLERLRIGEDCCFFTDLLCD